MTSSGKTVSLESSHLRLEYDLSRGRASLLTASSVPLLLHATAGAILPRSVVLADEAQYTRQSRVGLSTDPGIAGDQLIVSCTDTHRRLDLECRYTLLHDRPGAVFEVILSNVSSQPMVICAAEPLRALLDERSGCFFGAEHVHNRVHRVLRHGYLYSDPGEVMDIAWQGRRDMTSWWHAAFYIPDSHETLVLGYLDNQDGEGQILACWDLSRVWHHGRSSFDLTARALYHRAFVLPAGSQVSSGRCLLRVAAEPFSGLEDYAETCGRLHHVRLKPIINGWCAWFYAQTQATEDEQLRNAAFIARHLKPYGMEWVQVDDGYQRAFGEWQGNLLYPHGMSWLAAEIRKLGLKPGIWIAPYAISADADIVQQHPEWLAHDAAGNLQETASTRARYILDITHPGARQWLYQVFQTLGPVWGYDFIKIDFVEWTLLAIERYYDPTVSRAQAYRLGFETMRAAVGPDCHLLDCGPGPVTVGVIDSMRIEQDLPQNTWEQYVKHDSSNAPAMAKRYYFHKRTWINDADHIGLALLTVPQAQAVASLIALSGGTMISGDRLYALDATRLDILTKVFPAYGEAARPLDLFDKAFPEMFALPISREFGAWWLVGYFNWDEGAEARRTFDIARLGLDTGKPHMAYSFWTQRLLVVDDGQVPLQFPPASVQLFALHEARDVPQLLGTDRHYTQGAVELAQMHWDAAQQTLSGVGLGVPGLSWTLTIHVPEGFNWNRDRPTGHEPQHVSVVSYEPPLLRARLDFAQSEHVYWSFAFRARSSLESSYR
jgi:hypothetical protein